MRKRIYEIIEIADAGDIASLVYDRCMIAVILISIMPLFFKKGVPFFSTVDYATAGIFIIDYFLRLLTADYRRPGIGAKAFLLYPFSFFAVIDLLSILPVFLHVSTSLKLLKLFRLGKAFKALRMLRYSKSFNLILDIIARQRKALYAVCWLAGGYVLLSALIMFTVEPDSFPSFFDAFYWAVVTLTTVGYGDIYPVTVTGRIISMISSFMGIAIVALPTGIITGAYTSALKDEKDDETI